MAKVTTSSIGTKFDPLLSQSQKDAELGLVPLTTENKFSLTEQSDPLNRFSNIDAKEYGRDVSLFNSDLEASNTLNEIRAQKQSSAEQLLKGLGHIASTFGTEILKTPGYLLGGFGSLGNDKSVIENIVDNDWVNAFESLDETIKNQMPVYLTKEVEEGNIGRKLMSSAWWATTGADGIGFLLSMYAPGQAVKALNVGSKIGNVLESIAAETKLTKGASFLLKDTLAGGKMTAKGIDKLNSTSAVILNTYIESASEAANTFDNVRKQYLQSHPNASDEEVSKIASNAAANVMKANVGVLFLSNLFDELFLFKGFGRAADEAANKSLLGKMFKNGIIDGSQKLEKAGVKEFLKEVPGKVAANFAKEGLFEEGLQYQIQNHYENRASGKTKAGFFEDVFGNYYENLMNNPEMQESVVLGGILGSGASVFGLASDIKSKNDYLFGKGNSMPSFLGRFFNKKEKSESKGLLNIMNENFINSTRTILDIAETDADGKPVYENGKIKINEEKLKQSVEQKEGLLLLNQLHNLAILEGNKAEETYFGDLLNYNYFLPFYQQENGYEMLQQHISNQLVEMMAKKQEAVTGQQPTDAEKNELKTKLLAKAAEYKKVYDDVHTTSNVEMHVPVDNNEVYSGWKASVKNRKMQSLVAYNSAKKALDEIYTKYPQNDKEVDLTTMSPVEVMEYKTAKLLKTEYEKRLNDAKETYIKLSEKKSLKEDYDAYKKDVEDDVKAVEEAAKENQTVQQDVVEKNTSLDNLKSRIAKAGYTDEDNVILSDYDDNRYYFNPKTNVLKNAAGTIMNFKNYDEMYVFPKAQVVQKLQETEELQEKKEQVEKLRDDFKLTETLKEEHLPFLKGINDMMDTLMDIIKEIDSNKLKGKLKLQRQHRINKSTINFSILSLQISERRLKALRDDVSKLKDSEELTNNISNLLNKISNVVSLLEADRTSTVTTFNLITATDKEIEEADAHYNNQIDSLKSVKKELDKSLDTVLKGKSVVFNRVKNIIIEKLSNVTPVLQSNIEQAVTPEQFGIIDNSIYLQNETVKQLSELFNSEDFNNIYNNVNSFISSIENTLQKDYVETSAEVLDKLVDDSQKTTSTEIVDESEDIRDIFLNHALPSTPFTTTGVAVQYEESGERKGKDKIDAEGFPVITDNENQQLWFKTIDELADTIGDYVLTPVRATYESNDFNNTIGAKYKSARMAFDNSSEGTVFRITTTNPSTKSHHSGTKGNTFTSSSYIVRIGNHFVEQEDIGKPINQVRQYDPSQLDKNNKEIILVEIENNIYNDNQDEIQQVLANNNSNENNRKDDDLFVFLTDKQGNYVKRNGKFVFTSIRKTESMFPENKMPTVSPNYILNNYLTHLGINKEYVYDDVKNKTIKDLNLTAKEKSKLNGIETVQDLFEKGIEYNKKLYSDFRYELLNSEGKVLSVTGVTKGYPLYQLDSNGKKKQQPLAKAFPKKLSLKKGTFGNDQLQGGKLGVVMNTQLKINGQFVKLPQGTVYLKFDNEEFVVLQSRKLSNEEVMTVVYLLSLASSNKPLNTITVPLQSDKKYIVNGKDIGKNIPVFFKRTQTGGTNFSLLETMIHYGLRSDVKNKKGEIYIQGGNVIFTDFNNNVHELSLKVIAKAVEDNNFDSITELTDFLAQKKLNVHNKLLADNNTFFKPVFNGKELKFDSSQTYYEFLLNSKNPVLTTSSIQKEGYPNRLQRNIIYDPDLKILHKNNTTDESVEEIIQRQVVGFKSYMKKEEPDKISDFNYIRERLSNNPNVKLKFENAGYAYTDDIIDKIASGIYEPIQLPSGKLSPADRLNRLKNKGSVSLGRTPAVDKRVDVEDLLDKYIKNNIIQKNCK